MKGNGKAGATGPAQADNAIQDLDYSGDCPFCNILSAFPPVQPLDEPQKIAQILDPEKTDPPSMVVYSGAHVMAFLDIQPLTWGHTLVIPRRHRVKMGDLEAADGAELGRHLPLIARAVMRAVFDIQYDAEKLEVQGADYNIVQNNGPLAAQVVPHIHHHIIPRPSNPHRRSQSNRNPTPAQLTQPTSKQHASWTMFGRGYRTDLDENDPETQQLAQRIRHEIACEFSREGITRSYSRAGDYDQHGNNDSDSSTKNSKISNPPTLITNRALSPSATPPTNTSSPASRVISTSTGISDHQTSSPQRPDDPDQSKAPSASTHRAAVVGSGPGFQRANAIPVTRTQGATPAPAPAPTPGDAEPREHSRKNGREKL